MTADRRAQNCGFRVVQILGVIDFAAVGLGVQYGTVRLVRTDDRWPDIAHQLAVDIGART